MKLLAQLFYWLASRCDKRYPRFPEAIEKDMMIYGNGFAKKISSKEVYLN